MRTYGVLLSAAILLCPVVATAGTLAPAGGPTTGVLDADSNVGTTLATTLAGEDVSNDVQKTEERYSTIPIGGTTAMIAADQLYKPGPGYVRGIDCYGTDAAATAGTISLLDSTAAGSGNVLWSRTILAADYSIAGIKSDLQTPFAVGLYLDFTTTADMACIVRYR